MIKPIDMGSEYEITRVGGDPRTSQLHKLFR